MKTFVVGMLLVASATVSAFELPGRCSSYEEGTRFGKAIFTVADYLGMSVEELCDESRVYDVFPRGHNWQGMEPEEQDSTHTKVTIYHEYHACWYTLNDDTQKVLKKGCFNTF